MQKTKVFRIIKTIKYKIQKVTATASDGKAVTWVSLTSGVASVDSAGNITALAEVHRSLLHIPCTAQ